MTGRVRSVSSRSGQSLCWPSVAEVPLQALKSAVPLILCTDAGGSEQLAMMSGGGFLPCLERHSLRPENGAALPRQLQSRHSLLCDQRLSASRPGSHGPLFVEIGGTYQSGLGGGCAFILESASPLLSSIESSSIAGKLTKPALNPEEPIPGAACPWGGEREGDRAPVCSCLAYLSLHTSESTFRSVGQFRPKRQGRRREGDGTVAMSVQYKLPVCWC